MSTLLIMHRLLMALVFLVFTLLFTWQVVNITRDLTLQRLHQQGSDELLKVITELRSALGQYRYLPFLISQNVSVKELLAFSKSEKSAEVSLYLEQTNLVAGSSSLFLLNTEGRALAYSHWRDEDDFFQRSHNDQAYFQQAQSGHRGRQFSLNVATKRPAYFLSSPIYDGTRFIGAAVVRIELQNLVKKLRSVETVLIADNKGTLFFSTGSFQRFENLQAQARVSSHDLSNGVTTALWEKDNHHWLARSVSLDDLAWEVTVLNDTDVVNKNVRNATLFSFGGCIAFGLLMLLFRERQLKLRSQNETRQALARNEAQQKAIINHAQVGLLLIDSQGLIRFANKMALQQFAVLMKLILNRPIAELVVAEGDPLVNRLLTNLDWDAFSPLIGYESVGVRGDGTEFPLMISVRKMLPEISPTLKELALEKDESRQFLVTVIDISRRKGLEMELKRANNSLETKVEERTKALSEAQNELIQAGKMAALGRMSTAVVHELNQPLTAIRNYVAICKQLLNKPEMLTENLTEIDLLTQHMAQITSQLKTYAYKKPEDKQPVSIQMVIEHSLLLFKKRIADEQVELTTRLPEKVLYVLGDNARLEQVMVNLINNGLDAMRAQSPRQLSIEVVCKEKVHITISDSGTGIAEELLDSLFDPFVTSKKIGDGLGLGLAIVKSIIRDLEGDIVVGQCQLGGASFTVILPLFSEEH
ncbi:MAG: C4-dicarboxylate-specific signal transduction histidine kinase [Neptuniibacter pectenicola]|jgi:C4-dicarboxylate-specific signal transduction histidine kinase